MAWDVTQQPWLVSFPDRLPVGTRAYEPAFSFSWDIIPDPPDTDVSKQSKWQPTDVQPVRPIVYDRLGTSFATWIYNPNNFDPHFGIGWFPTDVQPSRPIIRASGTDSVRSMGFPGFDVHFFGQSPSSPHPDRTIVRDLGTKSVVVDWFPSVEMSEPGWKSVSVQPNRPILRAKGTDEVDPIYGRAFPFLGAWNPTYVQPQARPNGRDKGTVYVQGLAPDTSDVGSNFDWHPIFVQPARPIGRDRFGTSFATWIYDPTHADPASQLDWQTTFVQPSRAVPPTSGGESRPTYFAHAVYAGDWWPTYTQSDRTIVYAKGSTTSHGPGQPIPDPRTVWQQSVSIQPDRRPTRAHGTTLASAVWPHPVDTILEDRWHSVYIQPSRQIARDLGTVMVSGDYHRPGDPDPLRGTSSSSSPDPGRSTSIPAIRTGI